ncbi:unnamed protein product [Colias eurytheme]|nr:unnamed protein product [Colias eurytheme]
MLMCLSNIEIYASRSGGDRNLHERKFLYFAYGSNLLDRRMRINSPSAVFITPAKLPHYRLDFDKYLANWRGAVATIAEHFRSDVWGAIWAIDISEIAALDGKNDNPASVWDETDKWISNQSLFPHENGVGGKILHALQSSQIALVDNALKGTQLKLLLLIEGKQKVYFKPKRYNLDHVIKGNIYAGFDRHNSEVFAYYLAMVLNFKWIAPSVIRHIHLDKDIVPVATSGLRRTMVKNDNGALCIYGKCFYCKVNETVCPDSKGQVEGAAILFLDKTFKVYKSPWRRSYSSKKMEWETDNDFCTKVRGTLSTKRLLNLIDVAIFDFLIQNGDRHRYEVYKEQIILLDNGKGLGNPLVDELDILAPLYQCCIMASSTWQHLEIISGGSLTETVKILSAFQGHKLATEEHFRAVERRLLKIYATVQYCIGRYGSSKVFKNGF